MEEKKVKGSLLCLGLLTCGDVLKGIVFREFLSRLYISLAQK